MYVTRPSLWATLVFRCRFLTRLLDGWGFVYRIRASMVLDLRPRLPEIHFPPGYLACEWDEDRLPEVAVVDHAAYEGTIDARLYAPYFKTVAGCERMWRECINGKFGKFDPAHTLLLRHHGQICGDIMISTRGSKEAFIGNLAVLPERQGGAGKALLLTALHALREGGFERVSLAVTPDNQRAFQLYRRLGFRVTSYFPMAHFDRLR